MERKSVTRDYNGIRRTLVTDSEHPDRFGVFTEQNLDEILPGIARDRELQNPNGVNKLLARIPITIYERAVHEGWDEGDWKRWLNSSEAAPYRIWQGQV